MKQFRLFFMVLLATKLFAWGDIGHEVVAKIAWAQMNTATQEKVTKLLQLTAPFYEENKSFITASRWADLIKPGMPAYNNWHYINQAYILPPLTRAPDSDKVNIVYGLCQATKTLRTSRREFDKAWMLPMLIHLVGDVHQPLHGATQYTENKPEGDQGGNLFFVLVKGRTVNLHLYWDLGLGLLGEFNVPYRPVSTENPKTEPLAAKWAKEFPPAYFKDDIQDINLDHWVKTDLLLAKEFVYQTPEYAEPSESYVVAGQKLVKERVVLAGYRLAYLVQKIFDSNEKLNLGCPWTSEAKE
jgi:S1/P1 Nuclease